jgi:hypothetical protein
MSGALIGRLETENLVALGIDTTIVALELKGGLTRTTIRQSIIAQGGTLGSV